MTTINSNQSTQMTIDSSSKPSSNSSPPSPSKLRQIAPAPPSPTKTKSDYDVYHIPRGYEVVLVPKNTSSPSPLPITPLSPIASPLSSPTSSISSVSSLASKPITIPSKQSLNATKGSNGTWRKRKSAGHIPRPKNCFMAYREQMQHSVLAANPGMNNKIVSVLAAKQWNREPEHVKQYWREVAKRLKHEHMEKYPDYKFSPKKKAKGVKNGKGLTKSSGDDEQAKTNTAASTGNLLTPALWGHYRSPSTESSGSWTSDSTTNSSTFEASSPRSFTPPSFDDFEREPSPLRFEAPTTTSYDTFASQNTAFSTPNTAFSSPNFPSPNTTYSSPNLTFSSPNGEFHPHGFFEMEMPTLSLETLSFGEHGMPEGLLAPLEFNTARPAEQEQEVYGRFWGQNQNSGIIGGNGFAI